MRKLLIAILLMVAVGFVMAPIADAVSEPEVSPNRLLNNAGGRSSDPVRVYQLVRWGRQCIGNSTANNCSSLTADSVVIWDTLSDDGVTVDWSTTSGDAAIAGIISGTIQSCDSSQPTAADDEGNRNWGYVQVYGISDAAVEVDGSNNSSEASAKDLWCVSSDAGRVGWLHYQGDNPGGPQGQTDGGFFLDDWPATASTVEVFIRLQ